MENDDLNLKDLPKADLSKIAADLGGNMPEISPGALEQSETLRAAMGEAETALEGAGGDKEAMPLEGLTDEKGRPFDSRFHTVDAGGQPEMNSRGFLKMKRGGAQRSFVSADPPLSSGPTPPDAGEPGPVQPPFVDEARQAAEGFTSGYFAVGSQFFGPEFRPLKEWAAGLVEQYGIPQTTVEASNFREEITSALEKTFLKRGTPAQMEPEWLLVFALAMHGLFVFQLQGPRERAKNIFGKAWAKFKAWRVYRAELKKSKA